MADIRARVPTSELNERAQQLLRVLIESYIRDGQPVGSRMLSRESGLSLSSATIRNVMADLEELGFVTSPHTSAGRVPTDKGYRFFVDTLLHVPAAGAGRGHRDAPPVGLRVTTAPKALVAAASQLLSSVTHLAGVVTLPRKRSRRSSRRSSSWRCPRTACWRCSCSTTAKCRTASSSSIAISRRTS